MNIEYIEPWWKRIGCQRQPSFSTGEQVAMAAEIKELREALTPDPEALDYKELLKKYMRHVRDCEGVDFTNSLVDSDQEGEFNQAEVEALQAISKEITRV